MAASSSDLLADGRQRTNESSPTPINFGPVSNSSTFRPTKGCFVPGRRPSPPGVLRPEPEDALHAQWNVTSRGSSLRLHDAALYTGNHGVGSSSTSSRTAGLAEQGASWWSTPQTTLPPRLPGPGGRGRQGSRRTSGAPARADGLPSTRRAGQRPDRRNDSEPARAEHQRAAARPPLHVEHHDAQAARTSDYNGGSRVAKTFSQGLQFLASYNLLQGHGRRFRKHGASEPGDTNFLGHQPRSPAACHGSIRAPLRLLRRYLLPIFRGRTDGPARRRRLDLSAVLRWPPHRSPVTDSVGGDLISTASRRTPGHHGRFHQSQDDRRSLDLGERLPKSAFRRAFPAIRSRARRPQHLLRRRRETIDVGLYKSFGLRRGRGDELPLRGL